MTTQFVQCKNTMCAWLDNPQNAPYRWDLQHYDYCPMCKEPYAAQPPRGEVE